MKTNDFPGGDAAAAVSADRDHDVPPPTGENHPLKPKRGPDKQPRKRHRTGQLTLKLKTEAATAPLAAPPPEADYLGDFATYRTGVAKVEDPGAFLQGVPHSIDELQWRRDALRLPGEAKQTRDAIVVVYRWLPSLSNKDASPMNEVAGIWHLRRALEDDGMLEAEVCLEMLMGSDHLRSPADSTTYFGCLTRSIARLRREIDAIGAAGDGGSGPAMLSDGAILTAYVLGISSAPLEEIASETGLFADSIFSFYDYRTCGRLKAFFESTHFAQVRRMALRSYDDGLYTDADATGKKRATRLPVLLSHLMLLYASYKLIPPGFAYPEDQLRDAARGFDAYPDNAATATDALLASELDFLHAVRCMRVICRRSEAGGGGEETLGAAGYTCMRTYVALVQHQLLSVRRADPRIEVYRLGALVFAYGVVGYVVAPQCLRLLVEHLVEALRAPRYTDHQPPTLLFWAAVLGAIASAPKPGAVLDRTDPATVHYLRKAYYLVGEVKRLAQVLGLRSWEEAEGVVKDFVWTGAVCNTGAMYIWDLAHTRSDRGRLIGL
ncbi:hypothetical protein PG991_014319 [Apiospora marii]|uniref:Uncharacterized protein n=1 Tax=Apiospora marii TaxID=335849 RepID=A0ABR1R8I9_9PEZI